MNQYTPLIKNTLYETERIILELDRTFNIFSNNYTTLSKRLEKVHTTLKLINEDLQADAKAEDMYNDKREEDRKVEYMEQNEIQRMKWGEHGIDPNYEQAKADALENEKMTRSISDNLDYDDAKCGIETIADDVLRAVKGE